MPIRQLQLFNSVSEENKTVFGRLCCGECYEVIFGHMLKTEFLFLFCPEKSVEKRSSYANVFRCINLSLIAVSLLDSNLEQELISKTVSNVQLVLAGLK